MKSIKILLCLTLMLTAITVTYAQQKKPLVVLLKYKTQPGKDSIALSGLINLIEQVKKEPGYMNIIVHVDPNDKTNILLYEQWSDGNYYKGEHLNTPHLQKFMVEARSFLTGPPEISFWNMY